MKPIVPYLLFNGDCRQALEFYKACFGGELKVSTFAEAPPSENKEHAGAPHEIMHGTLQNGEFSLMACDWPNHEAKVGNNVQVCVECESVGHIEELFAALSRGGKALQPLSDTFWGARFGMLVDKFGINWMLNHHYS